jgi:hypothetical protein
MKGIIREGRLKSLISIAWYGLHRSIDSLFFEGGEGRKMRSHQSAISPPFSKLLHQKNLFQGDIHLTAKLRREDESHSFRSHGKNPERILPVTK